MSNITINGISVDPFAPSGLSTGAIGTMDASQTNYILVQTKGPLDRQQQSELSVLGVSMLAYVPDGTYEAHYLGTDLKAIQDRPYVSWTGAFPPGVKISPRLLPHQTELGVRTLLDVAALPARSFQDSPKTVDVVFHPRVEVTLELKKGIADAAGINVEDLQINDHKARVTVQPRCLTELAAIDEVRHIEEVLPLKLLNNEARKIIGIDSGPFEGEGQLVAVADTGFDLGLTDDVHTAFTGRVINLYALGRPGKSNDPNGHGTHVAGSILGDANSASLGPIRGTAPKAKLILQSIMDARGKLDGVPVDLRDLFTQPYINDGARIHTNSWGNEPGEGRYDTLAWETDDFVWNHRDFLICFAAGNDGRDVNGTGEVAQRSITSPGTAKNCITIGATESHRPEFELTYGNGWSSSFPCDPMASDRVADNPEGLAAFSGRGPTEDGRIKPDVVAPGTAILSTLSRAKQANKPGLGLHDHNLFFDAGTSMATPLVAGCVAVIREFLAKEHGIINPKAALLKALVINCGRDIRGQYQPSECGSIPNFNEGFGLVDMGNILAPASHNASLILIDEVTALKQGEHEERAVAIEAETTLLKVTLVWTDPPGFGLQNDLDLIVRASNGQELHGNMPTTPTDFDRVNNVEQVIWENPPEGSLQVIVKACRNLSPQSYALVIRTA